MQLHIKKMTYELDNEDGLSYIFFEFENGYFTISRLEDDETVYLEMNDQSNGQYIAPSCFEVLLEIQHFEIKYIKKSKIDTLYHAIYLTYDLLTQKQFIEIKNIVDKLFYTNIK